MVGLLMEAAPGLARVAVMFNPDRSPQSKFFVQAIDAAGASLGVQAIAAPVRATADIELALESFARQPNGGLILTSDTFTTLRGPLIANLADRYRLPSIGSGASFTKDGGLMYYGTDIDLAGEYRRAATYVDRILKGSKPGDLPVQAPDKYTFAINLKTAKTLGLEGEDLPVGTVVDAAIDAVAERAEPERHLEIVNGVAAEIEFVGRVVAYGPQEARRDQRGKRPNVLALDCVEECPIHFVKGGVRLVRILEDDLHLGIRDLMRLGATGRRCEKDCRDENNAQQIAGCHVHGYRNLLYSRSFAGGR
jgi:hypothetical protein